MPVDQSTEDAIPDLHKAYVRITGLDVTLTMQRIAMWRLWCSKGWIIPDLVIVVNHIRRKGGGYRWNNKEAVMARLRFPYLIGDVESFEENLAEARALHRAPRPAPARESALRSTGRVTDTAGSPAKSAEEIMRANAELKKLLEVRDKL